MRLPLAACSKRWMRKCRNSQQSCRCHNLTGVRMPTRILLAAERLRSEMSFLTGSKKIFVSGRLLILCNSDITFVNKFNFCKQAKTHSHSNRHFRSGALPILMMAIKYENVSAKFLLCCVAPAFRCQNCAARKCSLWWIFVEQFCGRRPPAPSIHTGNYVFFARASAERHIFRSKNIFQQNFQNR